MTDDLPEVWLRGPVEGYPAELQPVVHALLQVREEVARNAADLTPEQLWARPGNAGAIGFHLRHIAGATDRLLTYAREQSLTPAQLAWLKAEGVPGDPASTAAELVDVAQQGIDRALAQIRDIDLRTWLDPRSVGRARLPTTVIGLVFHVAEHASRHAGQIATMRKVVKDGPAAPKP
jgi:uncharacterized damage-inducible protein DinB